MTRLVGLRLGVDPAPWGVAGFRVDPDGVARVGTVRLEFGPASGAPVVAWQFAGAPDIDVSAVDGLATEHAAPPVRSAAGPGERQPAEHPNGVIALDHLVVLSPDLERTAAAIERELGSPRRRTRDASRGDQSIRQVFFRMGEPIVEVVGTPTPDPRGGPSRWYGLAFTVADLAATVEVLGDLVGEAKPAVQPGRRLATIRREAGLGLPVALMSPEPEHARPTDEGGSGGHGSQRPSSRARSA